jgi:hypothetical protein
MAVIDVFVRQSFCDTVDPGVRIGTEGLGTCLGVMARLEDKRIFCGHLDSKIEEPVPTGRGGGHDPQAYKAYLDSVQGALVRVLQRVMVGYCGRGSSVEKVVISSGSLTVWKKCGVTEAFLQVFRPTKGIVEWSADGMYCDKAGTIKRLGFSERLAYPGGRVGALQAGSLVGNGPFRLHSA